MSRLFTSFTARPNTNQKSKPMKIKPMKTAIKTLTALATVSVLAGCSGSGSGSGSIQLPADNELDDSTDNSGVVSVCDTELHETLTGSYDGQITYAPEKIRETDVPESCLWDVSLSIDTTASELNYTCEVTASLSSELISGTGDCADLITTADVTGFQSVDADAPQWPLVIDLRTTEYLDILAVYPTGNTHNAGTFSYVSDGLGNLTFASPSITAGYSGTLVQFSDQPFQIDVFSELSGLLSETDTRSNR